MNEDTLILELYKRDEETFKIVMNTYNEFLWAIVGGILYKIGSPPDIEDCISEVYLKLWEKPKLFNPQKSSLKTFLALLAKNSALEKYKKLTKFKYIDLSNILNVNNDDLMEYILKKEKFKELYDVIFTLKEPEKEIMIRKYFYDEKPSYIASNMSIPLKEIENRLYQSKLKVRNTICK